MRTDGINDGFRQTRIMPRVFCANEPDELGGSGGGGGDVKEEQAVANPLQKLEFEKSRRQILERNQQQDSPQSSAHPIETISPSEQVAQSAKAVLVVETGSGPVEAKPEKAQPTGGLVAGLVTASLTAQVGRRQEIDKLKELDEGKDKRIEELLNLLETANNLVDTSQKRVRQLEGENARLQTVTTQTALNVSNLIRTNLLQALENVRAVMKEKDPAQFAELSTAALAQVEAADKTANDVVNKLIGVRQLKILVIDDKPVIEGLLNEYLAKILGHTLTIVNNGDEGFKLAKKGSFDVIISGQEGQGKSGIDIAKELRSLNIKTPIVLLTASKFEDLMPELQGVEGINFLRKPFSSMVDLQSVVTSAVLFTLAEELGKSEKAPEVVRVQEAETTQMVPIAPPKISARPLSILVVDDEATNRELLLANLEILGHTVVTASNGQEALKIFGEGGDFDLVITDRQMPEMDGDQLASWIMSISPSTPVIMLTAQGQTMIKNGEKPRGVTLVLPKPYSQQGLQDAIEEVMPKEES